MQSISKPFGAEEAHKAMGYAPEDSELTIELGTKPLPSSEAHHIDRRARSGPMGRHARMPVAHASQGPKVRGRGEQATAYDDVLVLGTSPHLCSLCLHQRSYGCDAPYSRKSRGRGHVAMPLAGRGVSAPHS